MRVVELAPTLLTPWEQKQKDASGENPDSEVSEETQQIATTSIKEVEEDTTSAATAPEQSTNTSPSKEAESEVGTTSDPPTPVPVETLPKPDIDPEDQVNQERLMLDAIYAVENERLDLESQVVDASETLDELQQQLSEATQTRRKLLENLPESLIEIRSGRSVESIVKETKVAAKESLKPVVLQWHQRPTRDIATGIEGLGPEKLNKLCDACPTIGDANNCRIAATQVKKHFADELPRGIGRKIANELEKRIIEAETNHDTPSCAEQVKEPETTSAMPANRDMHTRLVTSIARSLQATATEGGLEAIDSEDFEAGATANKEGLSESSCPNFECSDDERNQRITEWVKGWQWSDSKNSQEEDAAIEVADTETISTQDSDTDQRNEDPGEPGNVLPSNETDQDHPELIHELIQQIMGAGQFDQIDGNEHWVSGYEVALDELPVESCPVDLPPHDRNQWIMGWISANSLGDSL